MLEARDVESDNRVVVGLALLHPATHRDQVVAGAPAGDGAGPEDQKLACLGVLQRQEYLELPGIDRLARQPLLPLRLVQIAQRLPVGRNEAGEHRSHVTNGRVALAQELDLADADLIVDQHRLCPLRDFGVVNLLAKDAILRKLDEGAARTDTMLGEVGPDWRATIRQRHFFLIAHRASFRFLALVIPILPARLGGDRFPSWSRMMCTSFLASGKCARTSSSRLTVGLSSQPLCFPHPEQRSSAACGPLPACTMPKPGAARVLKVRRALKLELEANERRKIWQTVECELLHRSSPCAASPKDAGASWELPLAPAAPPPRGVTSSQAPHCTA